MDLILTLSPSSSGKEFSQLKLIKTNLRSKLGQSALNHCMGTNMLAPCIKEHDQHPAIHYWDNMSIRARRPYYKDQIKTKVQTLELHTPPITASGDCDVVETSEDSAHSGDVLEGPSLEYLKLKCLQLKSMISIMTQRVIPIMIQVWMRRWYSLKY